MSLSTDLMNLLSLQEKEKLNNYLEIHKYRWELHAREKQILPEGDWQTWLMRMGRGAGKTRTGAETVRIWKDNNPIIHLVGATAADVRDIMVEGKSGLVNTSPKWDKAVYHSSKRKVTWNNGAYALLFSADEPDRLRGPECYKAWADELATWRYPDAWDQLQFGLRLGDNPQCIVTTTPRPTKIIRELATDPTTHQTIGTTYENRANLAKSFMDKIIKKYEGTRIGRQELNAEILEDVEGALWSSKLIDPYRVSKAPELVKIVIAIDPAVTSSKTSNETGIIAVGYANVMGRNGVEQHYYILDDYTGIYTPNQWATKSIQMFDYLEANEMIAETNNGGDLVETVIKGIDPTIPYRKVHASRGKVTRAEPVVGLYEQGRVHHVGSLAKLEDQMTTWDAGAGDPSPDRIDALVWGVTALNNNYEGWFA